MIPEGNLQSNVDRFNGFADNYDQTARKHRHSSWKSSAAIWSET